MNQPTRHLPAVTSACALLTLSLVACGSSPVATAEPGFAPIRITASLPKLSENSISRQGVPVGTASAELTVLQGAEELLFDANGRVSSNGSRISFTPSSSTRTLYLPINTTYDFKVKALDDRSPVNTLAYGEQLGVDVGSTGGSINLGFKTFVGSAALKTMLGVTSATPGEILDVALNVAPDGRPDLLVPETDYTVTYAVTGGSIVQHNDADVATQRGVRVQAAGGAPLNVTATVTGLKSPAPGTTGTTTASLSIPVNDVDSSTTVDITPPATSISVSPNTKSAVTVTGSMSDDVRVTKVELYDGALKYGDATLNGTSWSISWTPTPGDHDLQVLAYDAAGNVGRARAFSTTRFITMSTSFSGSYVHDLATSGDYAVVNGKVYKLTNGAWDVQATLDSGTAVETDGTNILVRNNDTVSVYRQNGTWTKEATLTGPSGVTYGSSLATSGDLAVVGASGANSSKGAVYVYTRSNGTWTQTANLTSSAASAEFFGSAVATNGTELFVGAYNANSGKGAVYVYTLSNGTWTLSDTLTPDPVNNHSYGYHLDLSGDRLLIGANSARTAVYEKDTAWQLSSVISKTGKGSQAGPFISVGGTVYRDFEGAWVQVNSLANLAGLTSNGIATASNDTYGNSAVKFYK